MFFFQLGQDFLCPGYQVGRHTGHPGYMNTKTVSAATRGQFSHKDDPVPNFPVGYMIIFYPLKFIFQLIQFMVVCCKKSFGLEG